MALPLHLINWRRWCCVWNLGFDWRTGSSFLELRVEARPADSSCNYCREAELDTEKLIIDFSHFDLLEDPEAESLVGCGEYDWLSYVGLFGICCFVRVQEVWNLFGDIELRCGELKSCNIQSDTWVLSAKFPPGACLFSKTGTLSLPLCGRNLWHFKPQLPF